MTIIFRDFTGKLLLWQILNGSHMHDDIQFSLRPGDRTDNSMEKIYLLWKYSQFSTHLGKVFKFGQFNGNWLIYIYIGSSLKYRMTWYYCLGGSVAKASEFTTQKYILKISSEMTICIAINVQWCWLTYQPIHVQFCTS